MAFALANPNALGWTPMIEITIDGREVAGAFYSVLIRASIKDEGGQTSDSCEIELDDRRNQLELPREKATIVIRIGYIESGLVDVGTFELQTPRMTGGEDGERLVLNAQAADLRRKHKGSRRKHYEDKTFGAIARDVAQRAGVSAVVDPEFDSLQVGYALQFDQSDIDFLTRLGDDHGAVVKPAAGKLVVARRGAAKSVSGQDVAAIIIRKSDCSGGWDVAPQGRPQYGLTKAGWVDQASGKTKWEQSETGLEGPDFTLPMLFPDQSEAKAASKAEGRALNSDTGDGWFRLYGRPGAQAEAQVIPIDFRREIVDGQWKAKSVEHVFDASGFITTVNIKAREEPKKGKT